MNDRMRTDSTLDDQQPVGDPHPGRVGVLLVNLGTPDAPTPKAVRKYLAEFLSDRRVVDYPRALWLPILHAVILNIRPQRSARLYAKVWTAEGSPLRLHTKSAAEALQARLAGRAHVDWAMRYGSRSIRERMNALVEAGCGRLLIIPMYPQYSRSTTGSVEDAVANAMAGKSAALNVSVAAPFFDQPLYIAALGRRAATHLRSLGWAPERVIISFHGAPKRWLRMGDPYYMQCAATARLLRETMGWSADFSPLAFQSKFGREEWLTPATEEVIREAAGAGVRRLAVITPGFMADCLETLEEIAIGGAMTFREAGGERFAAAPCLNESPEAIDLLEALVVRMATDTK